jgi:hypothetical protein
VPKLHLKLLSWFFPGFMTELDSLNCPVQFFVDTFVPWKIDPETNLYMQVASGEKARRTHIGHLFDQNQICQICQKKYDFITFMGLL